MEARADRSTPGTRSRPDLVHDVVAEALEQAHDGLGLAEQPALLLAHEPLHPVLAVALAAQGPPEAAHRLAAEAADVAAEQRSAAARGGTPGTAAARGAPRTRRRGSSRAGRSRSGTARAARPAARAVSRMFSSTNSRRPGAASADSSAMSYWPSTRWPMKPSSRPSWRVVIQRFASAMVALARPPPGGTTWSSRSFSSLPMSDANDAVLARTQPARSTTPERSTTPGSSVPSGARQRRHDPRHRLGVGRLGGAELVGRQRPRRPRQAPDREPLDGRPVDEALRARSAPSAGPRRSRPRPSAEPMRIPACHARSSRQDGRRSRRRHPASTPSSTDSTSGKSVPNSRPASVPKRPGVAGRQLAMDRRLGGPGCRLEPVDAQQLGQGGGGGRRGIDDRHALAGDGRDDRPQQRVVGAAEQQRVDGRARRPREDRLAVGIALAEEGRQARRDGRLRRRTREVAGLDHRHEVGRRVLVDLDRRVLVLDRVEIGMRADRGRRRDDPDPAVAGREGGRGRARADDAEDRQVVAPPVGRDADGRRGVAGHDEGLDVALDEGVERLGREGQHLARRCARRTAPARCRRGRSSTRAASAG